MNCRCRGTVPSRPNVEHKPDVSKEGNGVSKLGDTHGMEYKPVAPPKPEKSGKIVEWK